MYSITSHSYFALKPDGPSTLKTKYKKRKMWLEMVQEKPLTEKRTVKNIPQAMQKMRSKGTSSRITVCRFRQRKHCKNKKSRIQIFDLQILNTGIEFEIIVTWQLPSSQVHMVQMQKRFKSCQEIMHRHNIKKVPARIAAKHKEK